MNSKPEKLITIEDREDPYRAIFERLMRMVPDRDREDEKLKRLIAFRLRVDGEAAVNEYLVAKIRDAINCAYHGPLYNFLKDDTLEQICPTEKSGSNPPDVA